MLITFRREQMSLDIRFYKEESSKELNIKADINYMVILKENDKPFKLLPYNIGISMTLEGILSLNFQKRLMLIQL